MHRSSLLRRRPAHLVLAALLLLTTAGCFKKRSSFVAPSRPAQFSLAGVPWGVEQDSLTALLEPRGYNFNRVDKDGDLWYDGVVFRAPTRIYAFMGDNKKLVKMRVLIVTADEDAMTVYQRARSELIKQFGAPRETIETYRAPHRKGRNELRAIRDGKADIRTYWLPEGSRTAHVSVQVTEKLVVVVDYEAASWQRESLRRQRAER